MIHFNLISFAFYSNENHFIDVTFNWNIPFSFSIWSFYKNNIFVLFRLMFCLIKIRKAVSTNPIRDQNVKHNGAANIVKMGVEQHIFRPWIASYYQFILMMKNLKPVCYNSVIEWQSTFMLSLLFFTLILQQTSVSPVCLSRCVREQKTC
jgi:hypothetical protein